jgi:hypothetical protein
LITGTNTTILVTFVIYSYSVQSGVANVYYSGMYKVTIDGSQVAYHAAVYDGGTQQNSSATGSHKFFTSSVILELQNSGSAVASGNIKYILGS